ncbi:hypothetical protein SDC9_166994 [bioreactor metagenome]|uniref:Uncharacterized protein n=1 Tax=bioreactor metagenome TaxID=1076179 RepID=A0A645G114_9ZZZZ
MHHDVDTVIEDPAQRGAGRGVVDDERQAEGVRRGRPGVQVQDVELRVGEGLPEDQPGPVVDVLGELLGAVGIDESGLDAVLRQGVLEQREGAAVEGGGRDDVVPGVDQVEHGVRDGGRTGRGGQGTDAALQRGDPLLEDVLGRVHDAAVDVARLAEGEQVCGLFGGVEHVRGRLVDRDGPRVGRGIGLLLPGVDRERFGTVRHNELLAHP